MFDGRHRTNEILLRQGKVNAFLWFVYAFDLVHLQKMSFFACRDYSNDAWCFRFGFLALGWVAFGFTFLHILRDLIAKNGFAFSKKNHWKLQKQISVLLHIFVYCFNFTEMIEISVNFFWQIHSLFFIVVIAFAIFSIRRKIDKKIHEWTTRTYSK